MPDWSKFEEMWKKTKPVRKVFGPLKHQTVPVFEDCLNYPIKDVGRTGEPFPRDRTGEI